MYTHEKDKYYIVLLNIKLSDNENVKKFVPFTTFGEKICMNE